MQLLCLLLQQSYKSSLDSTFRSTEKINPEKLFSVENPLLFSLLLLAVILAITFIYYRFVIIPMRKKHLKEEENLRLQQAESIALFAELSPDPIFRLDENGKIILANNSAHKIFPHKVLLGETAQNLFPFIQNEEIKGIINQEKTVNQSALIGNNYFQFILEGISKLNICQVYGRDITELKNTESNLKEALVNAEESKRLKEFFLAQISHEIRSPLNVIVGCTDLLLEESKETISSEFGSILRSMKNNSKRLYRTFDLLLNMSQLQTGKYDVRLEKIDLYALLKTLQSDYTSLAEERGLVINLTNTIQEDAVVVADHYSITQIFANLIDNAIKYSKKGEINLNICRNGADICVDLKDTGKGMSKEYVNKLFAPFSQEEMGYTRRYEGTGLGLALVKSFVDINKAQIKVKSELSVGTTFTVIFNGDKKWGI
jgi:signal transduction histidine kinase